MKLVTDYFSEMCLQTFVDPSEDDILDFHWRHNTNSCLLSVDGDEGLFHFLLDGDGSSFLFDEWEDLKGALDTYIPGKPKVPLPSLLLLPLPLPLSTSLLLSL